MSGFRAALTLMTRLPIRVVDMAGAARWFPVVGALIGLVVGGVYTIGYGLMPSLLAALVAVVAGSILTGAIHEDGLADSVDALGSNGRGDDALRVMSDPRLGAHGTLALVVSVLWRVLALGSLTPWVATAALTAAHGLSRSGAAVMMATTPPARQEGLAWFASSGMRRGDAAVAGALGVSITALALGWWAVPALASVMVIDWWSRSVALKRVGGVTGDILGAGQQLAEMVVLAVVAIGVWNGGRPWWA
ncbi:MAG: adenosylcobinamide-GDP ribazoletransferase [Actinobacteria bacterium]|nr:adenosylcobinamide-GDP ribazoletransferase [Actinomycetota bacterium]